MSPTTQSTHSETTPIVSISPLTLEVPGRPVDLSLRVTAPVIGDGLPVILLSHGQGPSNHLSSLLGYGPIVNLWAAHGFVVVQPTHLSSATLRRDPRLQPDDPEAPLYWKSRATDMTHVLDQLDVLEAAVPTLAGRIDRAKVAVAGHSMGGHTASLLLGAQVIDAADGTRTTLSDARITAGVLLAAPGGGASLLPSIATQFPAFAGIDFSAMTTPTLVITGDDDPSTRFTSVGSSWHADAYHLSDGPKALLELPGAGHGLGGISGYDVAETTDESPDRVVTVARLSAAYLRSAFVPEDASWQLAREELAADQHRGGRIDVK